MLHIPKTAGRSIAHSLMELEGSFEVDVPLKLKKAGVFPTYDFLLSSFEKNIISKSYLKFLSCHYYKVSNILKDNKGKRFRDFKKLAVVRNPYDRAISSYYYCKKSSSENHVPHFGACLPKDIGFSEFITLKEDFNYEYQNHYGIGQVEYVGFNNIKDFSILKFEHLEDDFISTFKSFGIDVKGLKQKNVSSKKEITVDTLSSEDKNLIYSKYKNDFNILGYRK